MRRFTSDPRPLCAALLQSTAMSEESEISLSEICGRFRLDDPLGFLHEIYHILSGVYRMNGQRHDESVGDDMTTFAHLVYRNSWAQLELKLPAVDQAISTVRPNNSLAIRTPGPSLKVYRGGRDETFDIESYDCKSGSITKLGFARENERQLNLFSQHDDAELDVDQRLSPDGWFLVHSGNPDDGLLNVWIGAPRQPTLADLSSWSFVFHLPNLCEAYGCGEGGGSGGLAVEPSPVQPSGPAFDELAEPDLDLAPRSKHG